MTTDTITEPATKIVQFRITCDDPDLTMEDFILLLREALNDQPATKNVTLMTRHFAVDGVHLRPDQLAEKPPPAAEVPSDPEEINKRLDEIEEFVTNFTEAGDISFMLNEATKHGFLLKQFIRGCKDEDQREIAQALSDAIEERLAR